MMLAVEKQQSGRRDYQIRSIPGDSSSHMSCLANVLMGGGIGKAAQLPRRPVLFPRFVSSAPGPHRKNKFPFGQGPHPIRKRHFMDMFRFVGLPRSRSLSSRRAFFLSLLRTRSISSFRFLDGSEKQLPIWPTPCQDYIQDQCCRYILCKGLHGRVKQDIEQQGRDRAVKLLLSLKNDLNAIWLKTVKFAASQETSLLETVGNCIGGITEKQRHVKARGGGSGGIKSHFRYLVRLEEPDQMMCSEWILCVLFWRKMRYEAKVKIVGNVAMRLPALLLAKREISSTFENVQMRDIDILSCPSHKAVFLCLVTLTCDLMPPLACLLVWRMCWQQYGAMRTFLIASPLPRASTLGTRQHPMCRQCDPQFPIASTFTTILTWDPNRDDMMAQLPRSRSLSSRRAFFLSLLRTRSISSFRLFAARSGSEKQFPIWPRPRQDYIQDQCCRYILCKGLRGRVKQDIEQGENKDDMMAQLPRRRSLSSRRAFFLSLLRTRSISSFRLFAARSGSEKQFPIWPRPRQDYIQDQCCRYILCKERYQLNNLFTDKYWRMNCPKVVEAAPNRLIRTCWGA
eukprot:sb/3463470/